MTGRDRGGDQAGPDEETALVHELEALRGDRGRAAIVLDELSRHGRREGRAWVPVAAADVLGDGGSRLILSLTRDREPEVRDAAVFALLSLGSNASRLVLRTYAAGCTRARRRRESRRCRHLRTPATQPRSRSSKSVPPRPTRRRSVKRPPQPR